MLEVGRAKILESIVIAGADYRWPGSGQDMPGNRKKFLQHIHFSEVHFVSRDGRDQESTLVVI